VAVTFKAIQPYEIIEAHSPSLAADLKAYGIKFKVGLSHTHMVGADGYLVGVSHIEMKPSDFKKPAKGADFVSKVHQIYLNLKSNGYKPAESKMKKSTIDLLKGKTPNADYAFSEESVAAVGKTDGLAVMYGTMAQEAVDVIMKQDRVKLYEATKMYQPVFGTSPGKRYYTIAMSPGLKAAARYAHGELSVRLEGADVKTMMGHLNENGFSVKKMKSSTPELAYYASIHLEVSNSVIAKRALGAVLYGVGSNFTTPMPDLSVIEGKEE
jgi:hypothetical protein